MSTAASLIAGLMLQTPPPDAFSLRNVTVTELTRVEEISELRIASYLRLAVRAEDGSRAVVFMPAGSSGPRELGVERGAQCDLDGQTRPWVGQLGFVPPPPAAGERVAVATTFSCRLRADSGPADFVDALSASTPSVPTRSSTVVIVGVGEKPLVGSGMFHTATLILGQTEDGDINPYYMTFHGETFPLPPLGSRCTLHHEPVTHSLYTSVALHPASRPEVFWNFECEAPPTFDQMVRMRITAQSVPPPD
jgi:hypothetical protein